MAAAAGRRLDGRLALVTGASRGIGAAVAERYAVEGAHVILVARTVGGLEAVDDRIRALGGSATLVPFDLTEFAKIDELGAAIHERWGKLDILVGNAAILGELMPVHQMEPNLWQRTVDLNLTANWRLIRSMDPLLRASGTGRALFVTSGVTQGEFPFWGVYQATKCALEAIVRTYAAENKAFDLRVNLVDPGVVRTAMRAKAMPGEDPNDLPPPEDVTDVFVDLAEARCTRTGALVSA
jgi:NAD(P)-dependent dehydrogenase (short-subunit alcohol dehydrogenase family)